MLFKVADYFWENPELKKYIREVAEGAYLFKERESGKTMFILIRGFVALEGTRHGKKYLVELVQAGEFLGEKAVMSTGPHERFFSAQARSPLTVLELGLKDIEAIEKKGSAVMTDLLKRMFQIAASRLDRSNQIVRALRPASRAERFIRLVLHMARHSSRKTPFGTEIFLNKDMVHYYIEMKEFEIDQCLTTLEKRGIVVKQAENSFLVRDLKALEQAVAIVRDDLPSLEAI